MCSKSTTFWSSSLGALLVVVVLLAAGVASTPAHYRSESATVRRKDNADTSDGISATEAAENGLRQAHGWRGTHGYPARRQYLKKRILCGSLLHEAIAKRCLGRGYNDMPSPRATSHPGASDQCCVLGCDWNDLDAFCKPKPDNKSESSSMSSEEDMQPSPSSTSEWDSTVPSSNILRPVSVVQEEPKSVSVTERPHQGSEATNSLRRDTRHRYEVKTFEPVYRNTPVSSRRSSFIRR